MTYYGYSRRQRRRRHVWRVLFTILAIFVATIVMFMLFDLITSYDLPHFHGV